MDDSTGNLPAAHHVPAPSSETGEQPFAGGGEMGQLMRAMDWSQTPLGPVRHWPQPLLTTVSLCLASRSPIVLWWGPELCVFYNDAYRPSLGASKHPALGKPGREVWPEVWPTIGPLLDGVMARGVSTWSEDQLLPLDRFGFLEEVYFTYSYTPIRLESGAVEGVFCVATETTSSVLAERRMRAGRDLVAGLVDARTAEEVCERAAQVLAANVADVPFALLYLLDAERRNAHLAGSAGLERGSSLAPRLVALAGHDEAGAPDVESRGASVLAPWPLQRVAQTSQREVVSDLAAHWSGETLLLGRQRTPRSAVVLPVTEPGQSAPSAILVVGISAMLTLDNAYEGFFEVLVSHLSAGLAAAHAHEEERKRSEALAAIDRAKTAFFSNVSHEFRTPLTLMLGPIEDGLADRAHPLPPEQRTRQEIIQRNSLRLLKLVNTLLDFARIEAGRVQASYAPTDLGAFTAELASAFRSLIERAGLRLVVECLPLDEALTAPVYIDREMWEKVVLNLLSNAFKFTLDGSITVALRAVDDGRAVELVVRDTGVGIPAAELPRLFERFHRVEGMRARTHEGSGIGLALVRELVALHGGTIHAASDEGVGTAFFVRLPTGSAHLPAERVRAPAAAASTALGAAVYVEEAGRWLPDGATPEAAAERQDLGAQAHAGARSGAPARIVLADDNADMRDYLRRLLSTQYTVEAVANGTQALAAIRRERPDLVLADVMMPELDGFALLHALRADPATVTVPVMLLSARAGEEATVEGLAAGADDYLIKPFSAREVLGRVAARLEIERTRAEVTRRMNEFLGIASHELRTPLTSITANVQLARRQLVRASQQAARSGPEDRALLAIERSEMLLERAERQMIRLDRLVGDLLDVSRIQAGKLEMRLEPCDLLEIVRDSVREQRAAWPARTVELDLPRSRRLWVTADPDRLGQVATNFLTNALKYSAPDHGVAMSVHLQGAVTRVEVRDQGPGLSAEQQAHLFEQYYRVPGIEQQSGSGVGLGLGLYICKTIIERHGGQIGVDSTPGVGSTFWFTLRLDHQPH